ncbi:MAG: hypothetical protein DHS20C05_12280 [Hyphococcus sp.]|nr:MAG: hypothetical protein DHS20C05_12280 [Marinicaulis sp.]
MTASPIEKAKEFRKQLLNRLSELKKQRKSVEKQLDDVDKFIAMSEALEADDIEALEVFTGVPNESGTSKSKTNRKHRNSPKEEVAEAARVLIAANGKPMPRSDLFSALVERGLIIEGQNPEMILSTMLWRQKDKVVRLKGGGYWLAERPWKAKDYEPSAETLSHHQSLRAFTDSTREMLESTTNMGRINEMLSATSRAERVARMIERPVSQAEKVERMFRSVEKQHAVLAPKKSIFDE